MEERPSDIVIFFGRFHPMILHFPIGLLFIAFAMEVLSRFRRFRKYKPAVGFTLGLGAGSAVVTAVLGYMLAQTGEYGGDLLFVHQWSGIAVAIAALIAFVLRRSTTVLMDSAYMLAMCLMVVALMVAGHFGGSLTHGSEYLTQYMPNTVRTLAGLSPKERDEIKRIVDLESAVIFTDIVYPILDARCNSCHNESKSKGELRMHTAEALMKGGENGPVFIAGNAKTSEMIKRLHLPESDEKHMPPDGKKQLTDAQIQLLEWWIDQGAFFDKTVSQVKVSDEVQSVLNTLVDPDVNKSEVQKLMASQVDPADAQVIERLKDEGVRIMTLGGEVHWLQARVPVKRFTDSLMIQLTLVSEQLTWLDLSETSVTDKALPSVGKLRNLTRLNLENTHVTDEGMQFLKDLQYLEYLNLYGTQVSDEGIQHLSGLKNLRKLYVWKTNVSKEGADQFRNNSPGVRVNYGE